MKENVLDVLMYLFETYIGAKEEPEPDQNELRNELSRAGFGDIGHIWQYLAICSYT